MPLNETVYHMTPIEVEAVAGLAQGTSQTAVAAALGTSQPTISRINNKHKELIQAESARIIENTLTRIADRTIKEIDLASTMDKKQLLDKDNQQALARIDKKEETILKSVGIAPSHAPSIHVQQIFNDNRKTILSPGVAAMMRDRVGEIVEGEIVEEDNE